MAINLATKYSDKIATIFTSGSLFADKGTSEWSFTGVKTVKIVTPITTALTDYSRTGTARYGTPTEMQDTVQELTVTKDRAFAFTIDKGNNTEQMMIKNATKMLTLEVEEQVVPEADQRAAAVYVSGAGTVAGITKPDKTTIVSAIAKAVQTLNDARVPKTKRYLFITGDMYSILCQASEFTYLENMGTESVKNGVVGKIKGAQVIEVPTGDMPTNSYFLLAHESAICLVHKIKDTNVHQDPPGISGWLVEGRNLFDAFVIGARSKGLYSAVLSTSVQAAVTEAHTTPGTYVLTSANASGIKYTIDGTDPRYSDTALTIATGAGVEILAACKLKACAYSATKFPSAVAEFDAVPAS